MGGGGDPPGNYPHAMSLIIFRQTRKPTPHMDPKIMQNNCLHGCYDGSRAIMLHTFGLHGC